MKLIDPADANVTATEFAPLGEMVPFPTFEAVTTMVVFLKTAVIVSAAVTLLNTFCETAPIDTPLTKTSQM